VEAGRGRSKAEGGREGGRLDRGALSSEGDDGAKLAIAAREKRR